ncbi:MAG TPA: hypothetical protein VFR50_12440, partial [Casimicrobiaceae bacterium]|nr:hypothetical protein [Casimicrobiaceae bacterium]
MAVAPTILLAISVRAAVRTILRAMFGAAVARTTLRAMFGAGAARTTLRAMFGAGVARTTRPTTRDRHAAEHAEMNAAVRNYARGFAFVVAAAALNAPP